MKVTGHIHNYAEALLIVHAVRLGYVLPATTRLTSEERKQIDAGDIYCFIESEGGMRRWTDGQIWSPSKISGEFLIYYQVPRYLSKNGIKKNKANINFYEELHGNCGIEKNQDQYQIDVRTTLHKKTVCITLDSKVYHIISYYIPIFSSEPISSTPFFSSLSLALDRFSILKSPEFIKSLNPSNREKILEEKFQILKLSTNLGQNNIDKRKELEQQAVCGLLKLFKNISPENSRIN